MFDFDSIANTIIIATISSAIHIRSGINDTPTILLNGILIDPSIIPISAATVATLWFVSKYFITLDIPINPPSAPTPNTPISTIERLCTAFITYSYCPSIRSSDDPETPGSSIAHIPINPDINSTGSVCDACTGFNPMNMYDSIVNITVIAIAFILNASS